MCFFSFFLPVRLRLLLLTLAYFVGHKRAGSCSTVIHHVKVCVDQLILALGKMKIFFYILFLVRNVWFCIPLPTVESICLVSVVYSQNVGHVYMQNRITLLMCMFNNSIYGLAMKKT